MAKSKIGADEDRLGLHSVHQKSFREILCARFDKVRVESQHQRRIYPGSIESRDPLIERCEKARGLLGSKHSRGMREKSQHSRHCVALSSTFDDALQNLLMAAVYAVKI